MEEEIAAKGQNQTEICIKSDRNVKRNQQLQQQQQQHVEELLKMRQEPSGVENDEADENEWEDVDESDMDEYGKF
jgi:hypothetical protein